jgi:rod shape-determining protein MreD
MNNYQITFFTVFFLTIQLLLVDLLSLNLIRPDFLVIFIIYLSMIKGKMYGMTVGFTIGFLSNLFGVGSYFGLEALSLTIVGYLGGYLKNIYEKVLPYIFHILWILIILLHFLVICYFRYQNIYISQFI